MPRTAVSGPVVLVSADGAESAPSAVPLTIDPRGARPPRAAPATALGIDVEVQGNRVFYGAERQAQVSYLVRGTQPANVAVELIRLSDGVAITRWEPGLVAARDAADRHLGRHRRRQGAARRPLRLPRLRHLRRGRHRVLRAGPEAAPPTDGPAPGSFLFQRHLFPIRGAHNYGHRRRRVRRRPRPPGPGHLRQVRHPARRGARRRRQVQAVPLAPRATTSSSTATTRATTTPTCTCATPRSSTRATTSTPASRSASSATPAAPAAATCTSRSGRRRAGTAAGSAIDPLPLLQAWDKTSCPAASGSDVRGWWEGSGVVESPPARARAVTRVRPSAERPALDTRLSAESPSAT